MRDEQPVNALPETRQHFEILDGLRGVAALAVVIFHFMEWVYTDPGKNFIGHGFLAVDFFFCLSGFVIAYAYDDRIVTMGVRSFFKARLVRLHPLVFLGSVLGLIGYFIDPFTGTINESAGTITLLFLTSIFLIPFPMMEDRAFNLFGLNAPSWSLFWEYVANIFYALILYRIGKRSLLMLTLLGAASLCFVSYRSGNLLGGWSRDNFFDGGARVAYSFLAGLLIYRSNWIVKNRLGFWGMSLLLTLAFVMPGNSWNWLSEALVVLFYFPLMISLGAGSRLANQSKEVCQFLGNISYPLYMTHYAAIWIFGNYYLNKKPPVSDLPFIIIPGVLLMILFAYLVMKFYDIPVRRYLSGALRLKK